MNHGDAFLIVGRDLMWVSVWFSPIMFSSLALDTSPHKAFDYVGLSFLCYVAVCVLCYSAGAGWI